MNSVQSIKQTISYYKQLLNYENTIGVFVIFGQNIFNLLLSSGDGLKTADRI